jgi:hypothetical protein
MRTNAPAAVLVVAILNIIFGVGGVCCGLLGGAGVAARAAMPAPAPQAAGIHGAPDFRSFMEERIPGWLYLELTKAILVIVLAFLVLASGIGLFWVYPWARRLAIAYAVFSILLHCSYLVFQLAFVIPTVASLAQPV